jgi:hypothetical protein
MCVTTHGDVVLTYTKCIIFNILDVDMRLHHFISRLMAPGGSDDTVACDPVFRLDCERRGLGWMLEQSSFAGKESAGAVRAEVSPAK